jgi:hypothetical protein
VDDRSAPSLRPHHQRTIDRLVDTFGNDPRYPALIIGGSVAKGRAGEYSDVDILLVATDEEYARCAATGDTGYFNDTLCDYPGGYIDGKIIDLAFLTEVAERGSEPARAAFVGTFPAYSRIPGLPALLARIPVYPEHEQEARIRAFWGQVGILNWFIGEAEKRNDPYLLSHAVTNLVLFGGRLILAHNRILYPFHKWFMYELAHAPEQPANLIAQAESLLREPSKESADRFYESITGFRDWGLTEQEAFRHWTEDYEWAWRTARPPLADW